MSKPNKEKTVSAGGIMNYWTEIADAAVLTVIAEHRGAWQGPALRMFRREGLFSVGWCPLGLIATTDRLPTVMGIREIFGLPFRWTRRIMDTVDSRGSYYDPALRAAMLQAAGLTEEA